MCRQPNEDANTEQEERARALIQYSRINYLVIVFWVRHRGCAGPDTVHRHMDRPQTPPPRPVPSGNDLTPEQVRRIELNRLKAKAKLREREAARAESSSSARNANNKRPLQVVPAESKSPTAPPRPEASKSAPLKRDSRLGTYFEYDLSKMVNSKGGFLVEDLNPSDERIKTLEKQRADQRAAQKLDPRESSLVSRLACPSKLTFSATAVYLDPSLNPKCKECGSIDIDHVFKRVFGLLVCEKCKAEQPEKYSLLTKTECKEVRGLLSADAYVTSASRLSRIIF